jgi:gas vesicle protein
MPYNDFNQSTQDRQDQNINAKDFIIGALIGGIVGAAAAFLTAPKSGKELRSDLNEQASMLKEKSSQWKDTAMEKGTELANVAKEKGGDLAIAAKEKSATLSQTIQIQSTDLVNKVKTLKKDGDTKSDATLDNKVQKHAEDASVKLEEAKKAFEQTEQNLKKDSNSVDSSVDTPKF